MNIYPGQIINYSQQNQFPISSASCVFGGLGNLLSGLGNQTVFGNVNWPSPNVALWPQSVAYQLPYQPIVHKEPEVPVKPKSVSGTALELIEKLSRQEKFVAGEKMVCEEKTLAAVDLCHF